MQNQDHDRAWTLQEFTEKEQIVNKYFKRTQAVHKIKLASNFQLSGK